MSENEMPPIDEEAARQAVEAMRLNIFNGALPNIVKRVEAARVEHGPEIVERAIILESIIEFSNFINANRKYIPGEETDMVINLGIAAISAAAIEAKRKIEKSRIIMLR